MNRIKIIKTEKDHQEALAYMEELIERTPEPESDEGEQLNVLGKLIQDYESKVFPIDLPDPIDAIKFRMEQANLRPTDLVQYIGSRSRVSEILSGKRQLTLEMVRALETGLGIPAKVLIKKPVVDTESELELQHWNTRLIREMETYGYFGKDSLKTHDKSQLLKSFFSSIVLPAQLVGMPRKSHYRSAPTTDKYALYAWSIRVLEKAKKVKPSVTYTYGVVTLEFMRELAKLSVHVDGPVRAQKYLKEYGIILIIEPHLSRTHLDGATLLVNKKNPVIGLTLRYDRLDNFWFTLMHELAHIAKHFKDDICLFYDEIDGVKALELDEKETEADALAEEALLPVAKWEVSPARLIPSLTAASSLAKELNVHVAIIAGQIRHKGNTYMYLSKIVNEAKARHYFPEIPWKK
jgi:HTH-type transcriptional regulator/antitoxin HigA